MTLPARRIAAGWVVPMAGPPWREGAVLLDAAGRIVAAGPDASVPAPPGVRAERYPDLALLPGLVNAHTHLELTGLDGQAPEDDFPSWIRRIIALKAERAPVDFLRAASRGIRDCWAAGITTVADTGDSGAVLEALAELGGSGVAYHEVFGPDPVQADVVMEALPARLKGLARHVGPRVRLGLSPHAPYSVSGPLYARVSALAAERGFPLAVHVAESREETDLLERGEGGFASSWRERGIPLPPRPGCSPIAWLDRHGVLTPHTLCIHAVQAGEADLDGIARRGAAVAHCPRSNTRHGHGVAPLSGMLRRRIRVGVGTDSVASVAPLDLLAEARGARKSAGGEGKLTAKEALELATTGAAGAIGLGGEVGAIVPGFWGDLVLWDLPGAVDAENLWDTLLFRSPGDVVLTLVSGRDVYRRGVTHP